jgi:hypothetical protein
MRFRAQLRSAVRRAMITAAERNEVFGAASFASSRGCRSLRSESARTRVSSRPRVSPALIDPSEAVASHGATLDRSLTQRSASGALARRIHASRRHAWSLAFPRTAT